MTERPGTRIGSAATTWVLVSCFAVFGAAAADGAGDCSEIGPDGCPVQKMNCDLVQPATIFARGGLLDTQLTVRMRNEACVPVVDGRGGFVEWRQMRLRNYASPATPRGDTMGPTLRVRKATLRDTTRPFDPNANPVLEGKEGTRLRILLRNRLPNNSVPPMDCRPARYAVCSQNRQAQCICDDPTGPCTEADEFTCGRIPGDTCEMVTIAQQAPNCFHGPEVTNLHFHGSHVSPQPPQDYVFARVFSSHQVDPEPMPRFPGDPTFARGDYQTDIDPLPWNQSPGTLWYHPHKHGSTALQLINGMAGALLVAGALDDHLYQLYGVDPNDPQQLERFEKVLLVQQIWDDVLFFRNPRPTGFPPYPLVNGQLVPTIHMRYGEVQRWRLISATTNGSTQMAFAFTAADFPGFQVKQIAQDSVQFAPENYERQPLGNAADGFELSPGNRVDLLVRAPDAPADGAATTFYVMRRVIGKVSADVEKQMRAQNLHLSKAVGMAKGTASEFTGPLIQVRVSGSAVSPPMRLPTEWPAMPRFLRDLPGTNEADRTIAFSMPTDGRGRDTTGTPANQFFINGMQFQDSCAGVTVTRGEVERWKVTNSSSPAHPFHIHTNPFQLLSKRWWTSQGLQEIVFDPPYPWMDTVALPAGTHLRPSVTVLRHRFDDFTGGYVLHCHFLGHEDRGMMTRVQSVCPPVDPSSPVMFGTPVSGAADDCAVAPQDVAPLVDCPGILEE